MKKQYCLLIAIFLAIVFLPACSREKVREVPETDRLEIVTTIFPEYDWVQSILGENPAGADVTLLLDNGVDLHSFQPTAADILKISTCDLFVYVGGESDEWVQDALREAVNPDMVVIDLLDVLGEAAKIEVPLEGMQEEDKDEEEEDELDEHVWLSLRNAARFVQAISQALERLDPDNAEAYRQNCKEYIKQLELLDAQYRTAVSSSEMNTLLFGDRFPFRYLADDYRLTCFAAFSGCSAETEASFETISFLSGKVDELGLRAVMTIEGTDHRVAETIVRNTKTGEQKILTLDSMQSTTLADVQRGTTYLSVMEENLAVLTEALK